MIEKYWLHEGPDSGRCRRVSCVSSRVIPYTLPAMTCSAQVPSFFGLLPHGGNQVEDREVLSKINTGNISKVIRTSSSVLITTKDQ